jgi:Ras-related protein Rab-1A
MARSEHDYLFKLLLIVSSGVGKSALLQRYVQDGYDDAIRQTVGIDFQGRTIELDNKKIRLQIWDTAGVERFRAVSLAYYCGAHATLIVYDVTDSNSFNNILSRIEDIDRFATNGVKKLLIGNKSDMLGDKVVSYAAAKGLQTV